MLHNFDRSAILLQLRIQPHKFHIFCVIHAKPHIRNRLQWQFLFAKIQVIWSTEFIHFPIFLHCVENMHSNNPEKLFWQRTVQEDRELARVWGVFLHPQQEHSGFDIQAPISSGSLESRIQIPGTVFFMDIPGTPCWGLSQISVTVL